MKNRSFGLNFFFESVPLNEISTSDSSVSLFRALRTRKSTSKSIGDRQPRKWSKLSKNNQMGVFNGVEPDFDVNTTPSHPDSVESTLLKSIRDRQPREWSKKPENKQQGGFDGGESDLGFLLP